MYTNECEEHEIQHLNTSVDNGFLGAGLETWIHTTTVWFTSLKDSASLNTAPEKCAAVIGVSQLTLDAI